MATNKTQLYQLMALRHKKLPDWIIGKVPKHYKRCSASDEEIMELAVRGQADIGATFGDKLYFMQAVIAGAMLCGKYHRIILCTPSQYGKALADDTPVLTRHGWKRHGDLVVGDEVLGIHGEFVKVLAVGDKCEMDRIVTLQNGDEFICHHNHEWVLDDYSVIGTKDLMPHNVILGGNVVAGIRETKGVQGNCIQVEGGIYLVGKHLIPTHNSWLLGRVAILRAYMGNKEYVAGGRKSTTEIIMGHMLNALQYVPEEMEKNLTETESQLKKLSKSLSKTKISFQNGGFVEGITLGDTFSDTASNAAVGRGGDYIVDEAALVSEDTLAELGRIDFAKLGGEKCLLTMISNPHKPGVFWDELTQDDVPEGTFILWIDALTAVEEERFTEDAVLNGDFSNNRRTLRKYLLCELDVSGESMFETPRVVEKPEGEIIYRFLGVDAAYKGKDNLCVALVSVTADGKVHCEEIEALDKSNWIDGVTNREIIKEISRIARATTASLVCVDQGYGVWLIQGLMESGVPTLGIGFQWRPTPARVKANEYAATNAQNMRAEMHLDLQNLIEDDYFDITPDAYTKIKDVLPFVLADRRASGKIQVRPKVDIKRSIGRSPDELDSLLLAIHAVIVFFGESLTFTE